MIFPSWMTWYSAAKRMCMRDTEPAGGYLHKHWIRLFQIISTRVKDTGRRWRISVWDAPCILLHRDMIETIWKRIWIMERFTVTSHSKISISTFPDKSFTTPLIPDGWKAALIKAGPELRTPIQGALYLHCLFLLSYVPRTPHHRLNS